MIFLLRGIGTAGTLLFLSIPLYSRDPLTCSSLFILNFKYFSIAMKITGFLVLFFPYATYIVPGYSSTYLLVAVEAVRWDYTLNGYGLLENKVYSQKYYTQGTCMMKLPKRLKFLNCFYWRQKNRYNFGNMCPKNTNLYFFIRRIRQGSVWAGSFLYLTRATLLIWRLNNDGYYQGTCSTP